MSNAPSSMIGMNSVPSLGIERPGKVQDATRAPPGPVGSAGPAAARAGRLFSPIASRGFPFPAVLEDAGAQSDRDDEDRQQERGEEGDDDGEGQRREHLALDPLQGDDRDEGQGDDQLAEDARLPDFEDGLENGRRACALPRPVRLRCRWTFSTWMMVASMIMPMEMARPPSGHQVGLQARLFMTMKVSKATSGRARMTISAPRRLRKNRYRTTTTRMAPSARVLTTVWMLLPTISDLS